MADEPPLEIVVALHVGTVVYGNIRAADRLDFTVIGPAVNLVSRLETTAKTLNTAIVVSDDFARAYGRPLTSLGHHALRGLAKPTRAVRTDQYCRGKSFFISRMSRHVRRFDQRGDVATERRQGVQAPMNATAGGCGGAG